VSDAVRIEALQKRYGDVLAVEDVSLRVATGESFGYLGPNGSGKTTTIRCMLGFIAPSAGSVRIFDLDVGAHRAEVLARTGYLPGEFALWPSMTGAEVLSYLAALTPAPSSRRAELCDRFELSGADLRRQVRHYSRGMRQKLGIVQAFQHAPELVVLDEPTEGLDPVMQERFVRLLADHRAAGGTTFMSSHILSAVELAADRVGVVKRGRIVKTGAARDLTGERVRRCVLTLKEPAPPDLLAIEGVANVHSAEGLRFTFEFRGDMERLLARVATAKPSEFLAEPESLADAFFDVFGETR
jgi:ABC-2 type transport system ATP-binding protein